MEYFNYNKLIQEYGLNFLDANELINDFLNEIAELEAKLKIIFQMDIYIYYLQLLIKLKELLDIFIVKN